MFPLRPRGTSLPANRKSPSVWLLSFVTAVCPWLRPIATVPIVPLNKRFRLMAVRPRLSCMVVGRRQGFECGWIPVETDDIQGWRTVERRFPSIQARGENSFLKAAVSGGWSEVGGRLLRRSPT